MIIVSQDRDILVDFDNVESIWIYSDEKSRFSVEATADTNSTLGYYKTEERAKEILQEIVKKYDVLKKNTVYAQGDSGFTFNEHYYYEMPEK